MTIKAENTSAGLAVLLLDGLGFKGAQKRGAALALVDLMRSVVREELAPVKRGDTPAPGPMRIVERGKK